MKYTKLGNTDIEVSRICVGSMSFGQPSEDFLLWTLDQQESQNIIKHCLDNGINFYDTANCYAHGTSEEYLAQSFKNLGVNRHDVIIASKVYFNDGFLSREAILREIDGTLKRLQTDYVDLYQIHRFDYNTPMEETMETLDSLVKAGKVRAIGASAMYGYQFHNLQLCAEKNGWAQFQTLQNHYNLLYREDERDLIPVAKQYGVSLIPYSPLASGHLCRSTWDSDSIRSKTDKTSKRKYDDAKENDLEIIARVAEVAERYGVSMSEVALAWHWRREVTAPIVGVSKLKHFDYAIKALDLKLSDEDIFYMEEPYRAHDVKGAVKQNISLAAVEAHDDETK